MTTELPTTCRRCRTSAAHFDIAKVQDVCLGVERTRRELREGSTYCGECARKRVKELRRSDAYSAANRRAKEEGMNSQSDDCTVVAITKATGCHYRTALAAAKRQGYGRKGQTGLNSVQFDAALHEVAEKRGMSVRRVFDPADTVRGATRMPGPASPAEVAAALADREGDDVTVVFCATMRGSAHALSFVGGRFWNGSQGWSTQSEARLAWVVS